MAKIIDPDQLNLDTEIYIDTAGPKTVQLVAAGNLSDASPGATSGVITPASTVSGVGSGPGSNSPAMSGIGSGLPSTATMTGVESPAREPAWVVWVTAAALVIAAFAVRAETAGHTGFLCGEVRNRGRDREYRHDDRPERDRNLSPGPIALPTHSPQPGASGPAYGRIVNSSCVAPSTPMVRPYRRSPTNISSVNE